MKLGLWLGSENTALQDTLELGRSADAGGFDSLWCPEYWRSAAVPLAILAAETERVRLASAVFMAFPRSPFLIARTAVDLDELSSGRFVAGIGIGTLLMDLGWRREELPPPIAGLREYVEVLRRFWRTWYYEPGAPVEYRGRFYTVRTHGYVNSFGPTRPQVPVYIGAVQPQMLRLAGEMADGVIPSMIPSVRYLREEVRHFIAEGGARTGRDVTRVEVVAPVVCAVSEDRTKARFLARRQVAFYAGNPAYREILLRDGFERELREVQEAAARGDIEAMARAISDEMLDTVALTGSSDECRGGLARYAEVADVVVLHGPTYGLDRESILANNRAIVGAFGAGSGWA